MFKILKNYKKQIWALFLITIFIFANKLFPAQEIKSEDCLNGNCKEMASDFNLSGIKKIYSKNNVLSISSGEFFRFIFKEQSDQNTIIYIKLANSFDEEQIIGEIEFEKSEEETIREIIFQADQDYSDIIFEKKYDDNSNIKLDSFRFTKLNIKSEKEINSLTPTIFGRINEKVLLQSQDKKEESFDQLVEPKIILGQVFQTNADFISDIEVDIDVIKQKEQGNDDTYQFIIRKAVFEEGVPEIKNDELLNLNFSISEIEKFRQPNGKFKFPAYIKVQKGGYYFWGINNDKADPNRFNCLKIRGSKNNEAYAKGIIAVKKSGDSFSYIGDLYFLIYGAERNEYENKKILLGTTIEDLGNGKIFKYQTSQKRYDLIDLDDFSGEVFFDEKNNNIAGINKKSSNNEEMIYKFETPSSFNKFRVYAQQAYINWNSVDILYSFDNKKWNNIKSQSSFLNEWQIFDQEIIEKIAQKQLYLKIKPADVNLEYFKDKYGVANLKVEIELLNDN